MKLFTAFALTVLCVSSAPVAHSSDTISSHSEDQLAARGLIGGAVGDFRSAAHIPQHAEGVSASEIVANLAQSGDEAAHATMWQESIAGYTTEFMVTSAPGGQILVQYWVLRAGGGCELYQSVVYSKDGRM